MYNVQKDELLEGGKINEAIIDSVQKRMFLNDVLLKRTGYWGSKISKWLFPIEEIAHFSHPIVSLQLSL